MGVEGGVGDTWEKRYIYVGWECSEIGSNVLNYVKLFSFTKPQMFSPSKALRLPWKERRDELYIIRTQRRCPRPISGCAKGAMPCLHPYMALWWPWSLIRKTPQDVGETINFPHTTLSGHADWLTCVLNKDSRGGSLLLIPLPPRDGHQRFSLGGSSYYTELLHTPHTTISSTYYS